MTKLFSVRHGLFMFMAAIIAITAGCGFHLRGKTELAPSMARVAIKGVDIQLINAIEEALLFSGSEVKKVAEDDEEAMTTLDLTREFYERRVRSVDERGLATSYFLVYEVDFVLSDDTGKQILERKNLRQRREFNFDSTQVLQKETEERFLREDMQRELAQAILRILGTVKASMDIAPAQTIGQHIGPNQPLPAPPASQHAAFLSSRLSPSHS